MKETTDAAVAEGEQNVKEAKALSVGYLDKAKSIAENALETAQVSCVSFVAVQVGPTIDYFLVLYAGTRVQWRKCKRESLGCRVVYPSHSSVCGRNDCGVYTASH
jgi:hypothetical protein